MTMTNRALFLLYGPVLALALAACASSSSGKAGQAPSSATQQQIADQARDFRNDAYALGQMAERREMEAEVLAREVGADDPRVQDKRRLAQQLRAAADEADRQARTLRRSVPHGMVQ